MPRWRSIIFFFHGTATTEIYTLSLHDALPICHGSDKTLQVGYANHFYRSAHKFDWRIQQIGRGGSAGMPRPISYAVFCLKKKKKRNAHKNTQLVPHLPSSTDEIEDVNPALAHL